MVGKTDFTAEEWQALIAGPAYAGILVVMADPKSLGMVGEFVALAKALRNAEAAGPAEELIRALMTDMQDKPMEERDEGLPSDELKTKALTWLKKAVLVVDSKCKVDVAWGYKKWVLNIARATAEAHKEGSVFGFGGVRVTEKEHDVLSEIETVLDI